MSYSTISSLLNSTCFNILVTVARIYGLLKRMSREIKNEKCLIDVSTFTTSERCKSRGVSQTCTVIGKASAAKTVPSRFCTTRTYEPYSMGHAQPMRAAGTTTFGSYVMFNELRLKQLTGDTNAEINTDAILVGTKDSGSTFDGSSFFTRVIFLAILVPRSSHINRT